MTKKLHLGCGRTILAGWINLDMVSVEGVDVIADLDNCKTKPLPFADDSIDEFLASHLLEHIQQPLNLMEELHRIAKPNATMICHVPYGSSDDAFEDPTHIRQFFLNSFTYFSQPIYWRADYGYRGDWLIEKLILIVAAEKYKTKTAEEILYDVHKYRNVVLEMIIKLKAIKPIREAKRELLTNFPIEIQLTQIDSQ
ncbi:class I SAM-dependent methyltransferase [Bacillus toyonensis]|uniref:class I SAM-dependent methyltransferase n=1 Tax=Bacillus toyonensis TaxID=155322 RepID=UPI001C0B9DAD|nr:methyltransferase domain-containing protein [Bacillus toyonensis]MBU4643138.1 methyltransferase domain-containing protein [Bacillus toyonensis]